MEPSHRLNPKYKPPLHIKKPNKFILTDLDSSLQLPKEYIQELKAFLLKYDIHKSNRPHTGILYSNTSLQRTSRDRQHDECTHYDIYPPTTTQPPQPPQWSKSSLAKKKRYQEQKTFAKCQCVRFVVPGDEGSSASSNDDDEEDGDEEDGDGEEDDGEEDDDEDEEDDEEDNDGDENTEARKPWKYSQLAKMFEAYEHNSFKTGSFKGSRPIRHRSVLPYFG
jgi:hypothetical protein